MDLGHKGKRVLVTGGAKGIGAGISEVFAQEGADVLVNYRSDTQASEQFAMDLSARYGVRTACIKADVGSEEDVVRLFDQAEQIWGGVDILVNNAGKVYNDKLLDITYGKWQQCLSDNLTGQFLTSREFARRAIRQGRRGWIVNIISKAAIFTTTPGRIAYVSNKAGEVGLTHALAVELIEHGIHVNGVLPGHIMASRLEEEIRLRPENYQQRLQRAPLKRVGEPWEIGATVAFLASEQCALAVGSIVDVTGGLLLGY